MGHPVHIGKNERNRYSQKVMIQINDSDKSTESALNSEYIYCQNILYYTERKRYRETKTKRQTEIQKDKDKEADRETEIQIERETEIQTMRERER